MHHPKLEALIRRDSRFAYEAYEFVFAAMSHTLLMLGRKTPPEFRNAPAGTSPARAADSATEAESHIRNREMLEGIRDLALREFGLMARTVFRAWGINSTDDFGEIVFTLVEAGLIDRAAGDDRKDFHAVYDLDEALSRDYRIEAPHDVEDR